MTDATASRRAPPQGRRAPFFARALTARGAAAPRWRLRPGFVTSPLSARRKGLRPFEIASGREAKIIARGLARRAPIIASPAPLALTAWFDNRPPTGAPERTRRSFRVRIKAGEAR